MPDAAAIEQAEKVVRDVYKADLAKKKPADQAEAARKLTKAADDTKDNPAARFVLYREAGELGARSGDLVAALEAVAGMTQSFAVKPVEVQLPLLESAESSRVANGRVVADVALEVADDAIAMNDFESAFKLLKLASKSATRSGQTALVSSIASRTREVENIQQRFKATEADRKALASNASDPAAHSRMGRFQCFVRGDWDAGLPHLAKGSDEKLRAAAEKDLAQPLATSDRVELADRWFDLAATLEGTESVDARVRAYEWYLQALPDLSGINKTRVEKRIAEMEKSPDTRSNRAIGWRVLFRSSDPSIWNTDTNRGRGQCAVPVARAPIGIRYLRLTEAVRGLSVIIEMSKERLDGESERDGYGWAGKGRNEFQGYHLGIGDTAWGNGQRASIAVYNIPQQQVYYRGWGFGNRSFIDDVQGYSWGGEPVPKTMFEIAVKVGPLTAEEQKRLLKKKK